MAKATKIKMPDGTIIDLAGGASISYDEEQDAIIVNNNGSGSSGSSSDKEMTLLATVDVSQANTNIELTDLDNFTEFYIIRELVYNDSTTESGYQILINGTSIANNGCIISPNTQKNRYGYSRVIYNGLAWMVSVSAGSTSATNYSTGTAAELNMYNHVLGLGKATSFKLQPPISTYQAVNGIIKIYGR